jgi:3-oxoacyl-[acyl-carrier protein] reductase
MGLGYCYQRGVDSAVMNFFVYIPGDNTWPYRSLFELFGNLGKADVVTSYTTNPNVRPLGRRIVSAGFTKTMNFLFRRNMKYFNGLTIYPTSFLKNNTTSTRGFGFQAEMLLTALYDGLSVVECALPIDERNAGGSKAVTVKNITSVLATICRLIWRLRVNPLFSRPTSAGRRYVGNGWGPAGSSSVDEMRTQIKLDGTSECMQHRNGETTRFASAGAAAAAKPRLRPERPLGIIITGASSGIGAALAEALSADGHQLFICARRGERLAEIAQRYANVTAWNCDVSEEQQVLSFLANVRDAAEYVDVLINCAGTFGAIGPVAETDSQQWLYTLHVNLFGAYLFAKHATPLLDGAARPSIINVAGGGAFSPFPNYSAYACSKAALVRLTECLAAELAPRRIAVNALAPGMIATEAHEATLRAGERRAGPLQYRRTLAVMKDGGAPISAVIDCVNAMLSPEMAGLTGKTISANFDPWSTPAFLDRIPDITRSDLYTSRRYNIVNLPAGSLHNDLCRAWASYGGTS